MPERFIALALAGAVILLPAAAASAQTTVETHGVGAIGRYANPFTSGKLAAAAGGVEIFGAKGVGIGAEGGVFGGGGDRFLTLSVDGVAHLDRRDHTRKVSPFVGAGYTRLIILTDTGQSNAWHIRAGLNCWVGRRGAIRVEFLEILRHQSWTDRYWFARVGITFR